MVGVVAAFVFGLAVLALVVLGHSGSRSPTQSGVPAISVHVPTSGVFEIDATTHRVVSDVAYKLIAPGAADGFGARWIPSSRGVAKVDPGSGKIIGQVPLPNAGYNVVVSGHWVWAADETNTSTVYQIDPGRLRVIRRIDVPGLPYGNLYAGAGSVWETGQDFLTQISARSGSIVHQYPINPAQPANNAFVLRFGAGSAWVIDEHASAPGSSWPGVLYRIDPMTHEISARISIPSRSGNDFFELAYGDGTMWVADGQLGILRAVSPESNSVTQTLHVGYIDSIAVGGNAIWVVNATTGIKEFGTNGKLRWQATLPRHPQSIGVDGSRLWVSYGQDHQRGS
jgi:hypothetical protein